MSTRTAKDDSVFHQARYASSPEFDRGLIANLVAKRAAICDDAPDRELIWFIQYLSHQAGGVAAVAKDLIARYVDRIQTAAMVEIGMKPGKNCNAAQVEKIREGFPRKAGRTFLLKGETYDYLFGTCDAEEIGGMFSKSSAEIATANQQPAFYPATSFIEFCRDAAAENLENYLREICLNPALNLESGPWYFPGLIVALREYQADFIKAKTAGVFITALGQKVCDVLDYTAYCRGLTWMQGEARLGKSHAARTWCEQHPGNTRFVEVPTGNDEATFFRALARGLGLGNFLNYKVGEIKSRVESILLTGDIILVLDESQRLWPQMNLRYGSPKRIEHIMSWANKTPEHPAVPMCLISTPQFIQSQIAMGKNGWNSAQLTGRISHYESLPADLSPEDLMAVAKTVLPEADTQSLRALAVYARSSARYLAAIDSIAKRARYIAMRAGRATATTDDVRKAMQESVIPADTKLHRALDASGKGKPGKMPPAPVSPQAEMEPMPAPDSEEFLPAHSRLAPIATGSRQRAGNPLPLVEA
jgi:histone H3/H4